MSDIFILHPDRKGHPDGIAPSPFIPITCKEELTLGAFLPRCSSSPPPPSHSPPLSLTLEPVFPRGPCPSPRGYHSLTTFGARHCVVIGGRTEEGRIQGGQMVAVYDAAGEIYKW